MTPQVSQTERAGLAAVHPAIPMMSAIAASIFCFGRAFLGQTLARAS